MPKRILVVDDDRNIGQILHASFSSKGYETVVSRNGEDAIAKFSEIQPHLVLLDVLLPKMNGWEVCRKLKDTDLGAKTPIILMSAVYKNRKMQQDAVSKYGADEFVEKPFQLSKLLDRVEQLIGPGDAAAPETEAAPAEEAAAGPRQPGARGPVNLDGDLSSISFAELLHDVYVMGKTGHLLVQHGDVEKEIAIKGGYPVSIRTTLEEEYFGNFLVRKRKITPEQRDESVERMKSSKRLQGTILIEMGALTPHELVRFLRMQMREKLFEIFSWRDGTYKFTENAEVQGDLTTLDMSTANVINEGVRSHYDLDRLLAVVDQWRAHYIAPGSNLHYRFQDIELTPREQAIHELVDGVHTVEQVLDGLDIERTRAYQILYTLVVCEMVELREQPLAAPETIDARQADIEADTDAEFESGPAPTPAPAARPTPAPAAAPAAETAAAGEPEEAAAEEAAADAEAELTPLGGEPEEGAAASNLSEGEADTRARVLKMFNRVSQGNYIAVLDTNSNPTEHEVRVAYHRLAKDYHPDRFFGRASEEVRAQVEEIFRRITEAYEALNTQEKIAAYVKRLEDEDEGPRTDSRLEGVKRIILAEQAFQNGKQYLKERRFARAAAEFRRAMEVSPNEAEYIAYYGWSLHNVPKEKDISVEDRKLFEGQTDADLQFNGREALNRAVTINPRAERAYLFLGTIYKAQGLQEFAEKQFEKALICNPNCIEALRELRLIKLQAHKPATKKTFFDVLKETLKIK